MTINAKEVQELRKISGAGMMECKSALTEASGNVEKAFKLLREKGIAKAEKKSSREANEGLVGVTIDKNIAAMIEVNSETDFVSRNGEFHKLVRDILDLSLSYPDDVEKAKTSAVELVNEAVGKIGENIVLKRIKILKGNLYSYTHNSVSKGLGKIGVLVNINSEDKEVLDVGKNICMHIAALNPKSISRDDLDESIVSSEKEIIMQQLKDTGKPEKILEKMLEGKLNKFYEESTLLDQKFVIDPSITVRQYLEQSSEQNKCKLAIVEFLRFEIGS